LACVVDADISIEKVQGRGTYRISCFEVERVGTWMLLSRQLASAVTGDQLTERERHLCSILSDPHRQSKLQRRYVWL